MAVGFLKGADWPSSLKLQLVLGVFGDEGKFVARRLEGKNQHAGNDENKVGKERK